MWHDDLALTIKVNGVTVGDTSGSKDVAGASFGAGRPDWFDSLSPSTGTFSLLTTIDDLATLIGSSAVIGKAVVVAVGSTTLWTGVVDTLVESRSPGQPTTVSITAIDQVGQLGQARLDDESLSGPAMVTQQVVDVFGFAGLSPTVTARPTGSGVASLRAINPLSGSVLDWVATAEAESNAIIAPSANGDIVVCSRAYFDDYERRTWSLTSASDQSLWRMDDASGNIADNGDLGYAGTKEGTPTYGETGPWGTTGSDAIGFGKSDAADRFNVGDHFDLAGTAWTLSGWVRWGGDTATDEALLSKLSGGADGWRVSILTGSGRLALRAYSGGSTLISGGDLQSPASAIPSSTWVHWAIVRDGTDVTMYVDGAEVASGTFTGTLPNTAASLVIGGVSGLWFGGRMSMVAIWYATAITAAEVAWLIDPGHVELTGATEPHEWTRTLAASTIVNHWILRQSGKTSYTDATSISAYGDHTMEVSSSSPSSLTQLYSSGLRDTLAQPRHTVDCAIRVTGSAQSSVVALQPLDYVLRDGTMWQVMSVQHDIAPDRWDVRLSLSGTVGDLTGAGPVLPV